MARECACPEPFPSVVAVGTKLEQWEAEDIGAAYRAMELDEKLAFWKHQLEKCNKCYGCRNACPMCFCKDCELENALWVKHGRLPPEFPIYHMIRAFHLAGKCIACGECQRACPSDIPLMVLNTLLREDMEELFGYVSGTGADAENPLYPKEERQ
jgi:ferredoxin